MTAFYNEIDPHKAETLRLAIKAGAIAPGIVDERSIANVDPAELAEYTQCHFFAGGGFWSLALRQAGWPDDRPVWTGSCPCPSFSAAGKGQGFEDPRHLWPQWERLIRQCRPPVIFGEQVGAAIGYGWLDLVQADLEAADYAVGKAVLGACSVGAPHIRQRLYFVADSQWGRRGQRDTSERGISVSDPDLAAFGVEHTQSGGCGVSGNAVEPGSGRYAHGAEFADGVDDTERQRLERYAGDGRDGNQPGRLRTDAAGCTTETSEPCGLADTERDGWWTDEQGRRPEGRGADERDCEIGELGITAANGREDGTRVYGSDDRKGAGNGCQSMRPGPVNGFWRDADWIGCRDKKFRAVEPGTFPLAHGSPARVGRLRLYGDAICVPVAQSFIASYMETAEAEE